VIMLILCHTRLLLWKLSLDFNNIYTLVLWIYKRRFQNTTYVFCEYETIYPPGTCRWYKVVIALERFLVIIKSKFGEMSEFSSLN
jgi:hypothetical protein